LSAYSAKLRKYYNKIIGAMHKIYFENRCIMICPHDRKAMSDPNAILYNIGTNADIHTLIGMFETSDTLTKIFIQTDDVEDTYRRICSEFVEVNAGGGLVSNRRGDFLLIRRNGLWDLPKGHQDPGEDIEVTALREVQEETGIDQIELGDLICVTDHCYRRDGILHLKHTWWYNMLYTDPTDLTPQTEEDISKAAWVAKSSLPPYLLNTYPSIVEVFREAKV
jgi:ADP-ribose pyrophosphatase YjhB (NUDIX family)